LEARLGPLRIVSEIQGVVPAIDNSSVALRDTSPCTLHGHGPAAEREAFLAEEVSLCILACAAQTFIQ